MNSEFLVRQYRATDPQSNTTVTQNGMSVVRWHWFTGGLRFTVPCTGGNQKVSQGPPSDFIWHWSRNGQFKGCWLEVDYIHTVSLSAHFRFIVHVIFFGRNLKNATLNYAPEQTCIQKKYINYTIKHSAKWGSTSATKQIYSYKKKAGRDFIRSQGG